MKKVFILLISLLMLCIACVGLSSCGDATTTLPEVMTTTAPTTTTTAPTTTTEAMTAPEGPTSEGLAYNLNEDGSGYMVTGMGLCTDVYVVIPKTHKGYPVTAIDDQAFYGCSALKSVTIPDSVTSIGYEAFRSCSNLKKVIIPDSVMSIGREAFPSNLTIYCEIDSKPTGWDSIWSFCDSVVWGYKGE